MSNNKVELLSPAGNLEKLKLLSNMEQMLYMQVLVTFFKLEQEKSLHSETFKRGCDYTHARGKKVYATINGFPFNSQIELLKNI